MRVEMSEELGCAHVFSEDDANQVCAELNRCKVGEPFRVIWRGGIHQRVIASVQPSGRINAWLIFYDLAA